MKIISKLYIALIIFFLYAPIAVMVVFSFNSSNSTSVFEGFSLHWYAELFKNSTVLNSLGNTLILAVSSALIATVLGSAAAVGIFSYKKKWTKSTVMSVTNIPMMNPDIVTGISMMLLFVFFGRLLALRSSLSFVTLLIAHVTFNLPYVILSVMPKLNQLDSHLPEAALDLGCTPTKAFYKVILPAISSGIVTGFIMAFTLSIDDFVISYFTTGPEFQTLPLLIYSMTKRRVTPDMYALSTIMFVSVLLLLILFNFAQSRTNRKKADN
ncbi:MAG: ABC transporter permease [Acutalibacteraceae bacterium]|nr:ABC transporter permease [Acutalibacteraceae bacterium]